MQRGENVGSSSGSNSNSRSRKQPPASVPAASIPAGAELSSSSLGSVQSAALTHDSLGPVLWVTLRRGWQVNLFDLDKKETEKALKVDDWLMLQRYRDPAIEALYLVYALGPGRLGLSFLLLCGMAVYLLWTNVLWPNLVWYENENLVQPIWLGLLGLMAVVNVILYFWGRGRPDRVGASARIFEGLALLCYISSLAMRSFTTFYWASLYNLRTMKGVSLANGVDPWLTMIQFAPLLLPIPRPSLLSIPVLAIPPIGISLATLTLSKRERRTLSLFEPIVLHFLLGSLVSWMFFTHSRQKRKTFEVWVEDQRAARKFVKETTAVNDALRIVLPPVAVGKLLRGEPAFETSPRCTVAVWASIHRHAWATMHAVPTELILLDRIFRAFDEEVKRLTLVQKIKSAGDEYVVCTNLVQQQGEENGGQGENPIDGLDDGSQQRESALLELLSFAKFQRDKMRELFSGGKRKYPLQVFGCTGIHTGFCSAGLIGNRSLWYEVQGEAYSTARFLATRVPSLRPEETNRGGRPSQRLAFGNNDYIIAVTKETCELVPSVSVSRTYDLEVYSHNESCGTTFPPEDRPERVLTVKEIYGIPQYSHARERSFRWARRGSSSSLTALSGIGRGEEGEGQGSFRSAAVQQTYDENLFAKDRQRLLCSRIGINKKNAGLGGGVKMELPPATSPSPPTARTKSSFLEEGDRRPTPPPPPPRATTPGGASTPPPPTPVVVESSLEAKGIVTDSSSGGADPAIATSIGSTEGIEGITDYFQRLLSSKKWELLSLLNWNRTFDDDEIEQDFQQFEGGWIAAAQKGSCFHLALCGIFLFLSSVQGAVTAGSAVVWIVQLLVILVLIAARRLIQRKASRRQKRLAEVVDLILTTVVYGLDFVFLFTLASNYRATLHYRPAGLFPALATCALLQLSASQWSRISVVIFCLGGICIGFQVYNVHYYFEPFPDRSGFGVALNPIVHTLIIIHGASLLARMRRERFVAHYRAEKLREAVQRHFELQKGWLKMVAPSELADLLLQKYEQKVPTVQEMLDATVCFLRIGDLSTVDLSNPTKALATIETVYSNLEAAIGHCRGLVVKVHTLGDEVLLVGPLVSVDPSVASLLPTDTFQELGIHNYSAKNRTSKASSGELLRFTTFMMLKLIYRFLSHSAHKKGTTSTTTGQSSAVYPKVTACLHTDTVLSGIVGSAPPTFAVSGPAVLTAHRILAELAVPCCVMTTQTKRQFTQDANEVLLVPSDYKLLRKMPQTATATTTIQQGEETIDLSSCCSPASTVDGGSFPSPRPGAFPGGPLGTSSTALTRTSGGDDGSATGTGSGNASKGTAPSLGGSTGSGPEREESSPDEDKCLPAKTTILLSPRMFGGGQRNRGTSPRSSSATTSKGESPHQSNLSVCASTATATVSVLWKVQQPVSLSLAGLGVHRLCFLEWFPHGSSASSYPQQPPLQSLPLTQCEQAAAGSGGLEKGGSD